MWTRRDWLKGLSGAAACASAQTSGDTLYVNGNIITMDAANRITQAVLVRDGKIVALGSEAAGSKAQKIDLRGRTLLPGLYAAHDHFPSWGAVALFDVDLNSPPIGKVETMAELIAALRERAKQTPPGEWILGSGYDDTMLREQRHPNRHDLDEASTEHPIWIGHISGHLGAANSKALALAGIDKNSPPSKQGVIHREANGEPDGVFEENGGLITSHIPGRSAEKQQQAIARANAEYLSKGVTTTVIAGASPRGITDMKSAIANGNMHIRAVCLLSSGIPARYEQGVALGSDRVRITGVKLFQDGSLQGYTGHLSAPYYKMPPNYKGAKPDYTGYSKHTQEELNALVAKHHNAGYQIAIHANGDAAIGEVLTAYREAQRAFPRTGVHHRIEHCQTVRPDQLDEIVRQGVTPSFFIGHVYFWGDRHRDLFLGPSERKAARISLHSPLPQRVEFDSPFTTIRTLSRQSTRCCWYGVSGQSSRRATERCWDPRSASRSFRHCGR